MLRRANGPLLKIRFFFASLLPSLLISFCLASCSNSSHNDPSSLTFLIESSPTNLDPRFATDSQSQRIDGLLFSGLLERDNQMNFHGDLGASWSTPDPLTYVFHLRRGVCFHDGRPLTSADVKATFEFIRNPANKSPKQGALRMVGSFGTPDDVTVVFHLSQAYASFDGNLIPTAIGIVPANAGADFSRHPIGSGPFRFVRQSQDEEVVVERNPEYFREAPQLARVRFRVVPDGVVRALELRKGSADLEMSSLSPDIIPVLARQPELAVTDRNGTGIQLEVRPLELATLFSDVAKGNFQITYQR